jgi:septum formation protein
MPFKRISRSFPLILASASPRRKRLLEQIDLPFDILPCDIDENNVKGVPFEIAQRLAEKKALRACSQLFERWILGADTIVVMDDVVLGKPGNTQEAKEMLNLLSDREHEVITGLSIINPAGEIAETRHDRTIVRVKKLYQEEIDAYIKTGEPFGKAGGYGIQGIGSFMIKGINGSYTNVVGLPLYTLIELLAEIKAIDRYPMNFNKF